ncbi:MAG: hypothetical protein ACOC2W_04205 [bacterium]
MLSKEIMSEVSKMDGRDLTELINLIKWRRDILEKSNVCKYEIGTRVEFDSDGNVVKGKVIKINRKTIKVRTDKGVLWKVSGSLLRSSI